MPEAIIDHAAGRRFPALDTVNPDILMGLNKLRQMRGERDPRPDAPPVASRFMPEPPGLQGARTETEGVQPPGLPGQAELFPPPAGSAKEQRLLF